MRDRGAVKGIAIEHTLRRAVESLPVITTGPGGGEKDGNK